MMETDPDWGPSLHLGHTSVTPTKTARSARLSRREQLRKETLQTPEMGVQQDANIEELQTKEGPSEPGEINSHQQNEEGTPDAGEESGKLQTEEGTHEAGEGDQLITEDETHNTSQDVTQTVIIDCFEIFTEKPNLKARKAHAQMFSSYKYHHTIKYFIGITPKGAICFLSKGWGGCTSDKHITLNSGFLDNLLPGDIVLAERF
ncbi:uncharacterized protein LOC130919411 [Corythoichthys intestinalis]|uniref:uncharacterized protein LOC130919411 n=1 Tax=Corythoichthys intestinalis TaxID=161448 RepID=UPI0025A6807A|nr:uncharacterized protein LOC130919411 [Corythoichthys intestinalis]XP_057698061.1 uncharacterized protein LOC130919411 [Corythoichthys intestinalis]